MLTGRNFSWNTPQFHLKVSFTPKNIGQQKRLYIHHTVFWSEIYEYWKGLSVVGKYFIFSYLFKITLPVSQFSLRNHSQPKNVNSHYAGMPKQREKQKDPYLMAWNPKPELRKSHVVLSHITFEEHVAKFSLLKQMLTNSDLQEAKSRTVKRHARSNFCVTCRRTHVLG